MPFWRERGWWRYSRKSSIGDHERVAAERRRVGSERGSPAFRRRLRSVPVVRWFGYPWETVSDDAPLTPAQAARWRWLVLGVLVVGNLAVIIARN
jgi:hypothetical protein